MENFDKKVKEKLLSYPTSELPAESELMKMMSMLDEALPTEKGSVTIDSEAKPSFSIKIFYKLAASISFLFIAFYSVLLLNDVSIEATEIAVKTVKLPDGSQVNMKDGASIKYNKLLWLFNRDLTFEGVGFFEVEKGEKFSVHSMLGSTQVLGTSFTIISNQTKYEVGCLTGKVSVTSKSTGENVLLLPGDGIVLNKAIFKVIKLERLGEPSWVSGEFYFEDESFDNVISILQDQYSVEISYPKEVEKLKYTGYFDNKDLKKALKLVCEPLELEYNFDGKKIKLSALN